MARISQYKKSAMPELQDHAIGTDASQSDQTANFCFSDVQRLFKRNMGLPNLSVGRTLTEDMTSVSVDDFSGANAIIVGATNSGASITFTDIRPRDRQGNILSDAPAVGTLFTVVNAHSDAQATNVMHGQTTTAGVESTQTTQVSGGSSVTFIYTGSNNWIQL